MEIPTNKINDELDNLADILIADESQPASRIKTVIDAMDVIKSQAREIRELQTVIVRLRDSLLLAGMSGGMVDNLLLTNELDKMEGA